MEASDLASDPGVGAWEEGQKFAFSEAGVQHELPLGKSRESSRSEDLMPGWARHLSSSRCRDMWPYRHPRLRIF